MEHKRHSIRNLLQGSGFAMVTFTKKDGSERKMLVQPAAAKYHLTEQPSEAAQQAAAARQRNNPHLLNVWDVDRKAFRSINLDTVTRIAIGGKEYTYDTQ